MSELAVPLPACCRLARVLIERKLPALAAGSGGVVTPEQTHSG